MERLHNPSNLEKIHSPSIQEGQATYWQKTISSPVGPLTLVADDTALLFLHWGHDLPQSIESSRENKKSSPILAATEAQLKEYFLGKRTSFAIPIALTGTFFQKQVWQQLLNIPYGQSITYGEQARRLGQPKAARAVGAANGKNPIGIIVPCHRVLGASGCLTGFAGGIEVKKQLLAIEGIHVNDTSRGIHN